MITYESKFGRTVVRLNGKIVGNIVYVRGKGFVYHPVGNKKHAGEGFVTLEACKRSLEA